MSCFIRKQEMSLFFLKKTIYFNEKKNIFDTDGLKLGNTRLKCRATSRYLLAMLIQKW